MRLSDKKARNRFLGFYFCLIFIIPVTISSAQESVPKGDIIVMPSDNIFADSARYYLDGYRRILADLLNFPLDTTVVVYIGATVHPELQDVIFGTIQQRDAS